jgi:hypothetical protein
MALGRAPRGVYLVIPGTHTYTHARTHEHTTPTILESYSSSGTGGGSVLDEM